MHIFDNLNEFIQRHPGLFVLTGAGCSTDSGIPDYRNADGEWKHKPPVQYQDFIRSKRIRQRYWARSMVGWRAFARARPNPAHFALARLEAAGFVRQLVTQNVDGLHQRAGSRRVIDLHGRLDAVACLDCHKRLPRADVQRTLVALNPDFEACSAGAAPDGDARLEAVDFARFQIPACQGCGGILKPTVVFFGESVPRPRVQRAMAKLEQAPALLVVGSSLTVFSGYRFCRRAAAIPIPMGAINLGRTRADSELALKIREPCSDALSKLVEQLGI